MFNPNRYIGNDDAHLCHDSLQMPEVTGKMEMEDDVIIEENQETGTTVDHREDVIVESPENSLIDTDEPVPSTSKGLHASEVVVDLVSSEDEDCKEFGMKVWGKFIPNPKEPFTMPPPKLIPPSIPCGDNVCKVDLKDKYDKELEFLVGEMSLKDDKNGRCSSDSYHSFNLSGVKSWKEWRQNVFQESSNLLNKSLLASLDYVNSEAVTEKLLLWGENPKEKESSVENKIVFEMYTSTGEGYSRKKAFEGNPNYYVVIAKHDDEVPDFELFGSSMNGVPILIAVVCDGGDKDVVFLTADRSPLNYLF